MRWQVIDELALSGRTNALTPSEGLIEAFEPWLGSIADRVEAPPHHTLPAGPIGDRERQDSGVGRIDPKSRRFGARSG